MWFFFTQFYINSSFFFFFISQWEKLATNYLFCENRIDIFSPSTSVSLYAYRVSNLVYCTPISEKTWQCSLKHCWTMYKSSCYLTMIVRRHSHQANWSFFFLTSPVSEISATSQHQLSVCSKWRNVLVTMAQSHSAEFVSICLASDYHKKKTRSCFCSIISSNHTCK